MVSAGSYILSAAALLALVLSLGFSAVCLRRRLLPGWRGAPARLLESVAALALLIWLAELLGTFGLLHTWTLLTSSLLLTAALAVLLRPVASAQPSLPATGPAGQGTLLMWLITVGVVAVVFAHWGLTTKDALDRGIFNFDSLWYHMPFAVDIAQSHSVTGLHYTDTVFANWLYPQNSELLHAVGILLTHRDTLSLFLNFAFLALAFLAAWCVGRPYGRGHLTVVAAAILLECHTLVVREPGAAKNDLMAAALLLATIAILINAWPAGREGEAGAGERGALPPGWPLALAGLATGMAVGTKSTALAMAAALTVAVVVLAPAGRRWAATGWWFIPAFAGGGYWYLRNLVVSGGNPLPQVERLGPIALPHPEHLQSGRPDFNIVHYATDTGVWRQYFGPGLDQAFGALWPLVIAAAIAGAVLAILRGRERVVRWSGGVALFGMLAYLLTPLSAAGAEGAPLGFAINIRYAIPALLAGIVLLPARPWLGAGSRAPLAAARSERRWQWGLLVAFLAVLVLTNRSDAVLRDPSRVFGLLLAALLVLAPAALLLARSRGASRALLAGGCALLALALLALGYPLQRDYLEGRYRNDASATSIPGMNLDSAYRWARGVEDRRIGLAGTTAGFLQYGFYGRDLSNRVLYLGERGPHAAFNAIPSCRAFRAAVNDADLDYLVTAPFLNFLHPERPIASPEAGWLRGEPAVRPLEREGQVTVWKVEGELDPDACGRANAPLRRVPMTPSA